MKAEQTNKIIVKILGKIYGLISSVIILAALIIVALFIFGVKPYAVQTGSMEPAIKTGSLCLVNTRVDFSKIKEGDIIAFRSGESLLITHRVKEVTDTGLVTKGDANNAEDSSTVKEENYVGKTIFSVPYIGYAFLFAHTKRGLFVCATVFLAFFLAGFLFKNDNKSTEE